MTLSVTKLCAQIWLDVIYLLLFVIHLVIYFLLTVLLITLITHLDFSFHISFLRYLITGEFEISLFSKT